MAALYDGFIKNKQGIKAHAKEQDIDDSPLNKKKNDSPNSMKEESDENKKKTSHKDESEMGSSPMIKRILQRGIKKNQHKNNARRHHQHHNHNALEKEPNFHYEHFTISYQANDDKPPLFIVYAYQILNSRTFNNIILLCLILNITTIAMERVDMSDSEKFKMNMINFSCTIVFFIEIMLRFFILGPKKFWWNHFDKIDFIIIWLNMFDVIYLSVNGNDIFRNESSLTSIIKCLKTFRTIRFLVGLQYWHRGSVLFIEMVNALVKTKEFVILVLISIFVGALMGMEFFSYRIRYINEDEIAEDLALGTPPRLNYDSISDALMTTTMIFLNEEWHVIMYEHMRIIGKRAGVYFITVLLIGEVILIRMFMALFINGVIHSENIKNLLKIENSWKRMLKSIFKINNKEEFKEKMLKIMFPWNKNEKETSIKLNTQIHQTKLIEMIENEEKNEKPAIHIHSLTDEGVKHEVPKKLTVQSQKFHGSSTFKATEEKIILPDRKVVGFQIWFRTLCKLIVNHHYFEKVILATILISVVFLMIHNPMKSPDALENKIQFYVDVTVIVFYFLEILLKITGNGLLFSGPKSFLLDLWNIFDLFLFALTVLGTIDTKYSFSTVNFKWCRIFRIFKIIKLTKGLKNAMNILFKSIPDLISLTFFYFMNLFVFGIIAVNYLKGVFFYCVTIDEELANLVYTREDCFDHGGDWINHDLNFDNIFSSLSTLFQISTTEGWVEEMFNGIDFVGVKRNPIKDNHKVMALFYISFFIIANLIVINMFIGILVETYLHQKNLKCTLNFYLFLKVDLFSPVWTFD